MATRTPQELGATLKDGLLSFPVTAFNDDLSLNEAAYGEHIAWQSSKGVAGLFAAGGTGEGFSLSPEEHRRVLDIAIAESNPEVPVLGSASGATWQAVQNVKDAEKAGAEGVLALPPYLTECTQEGLFEHVSAICRATSIGVIVYNRANAIYSAETVERLADAHPNFIGFKDAIGDIEHLAKVHARNGDRLFYLGGLPTAETYALPLLQLGLSTYSSAIYNFLPEFALEFYADVRALNHSAVTEKLRRFVLPYIAIRDRGAGYGVSIVKAGLRSIGRDVGSVRPPLRNLFEREQEELDNLIRTAGVSPATR